MTKLEKRIISIMLTCVIVFSTVFSVEFSVNAENAPKAEEEVESETNIIGQNGNLSELSDNGGELQVNSYSVPDYETGVEENFDEPTYTWEEEEDTMKCTAKRYSVDRPEYFEEEVYVCDNYMDVYTIEKCGQEIQILFKARFKNSWAQEQEKYIPTGEYAEHIYWMNIDDPENHYLKCERCGDIKDVEPHDYGDWMVSTPASPSETGIEKRTCKICGRIEEREIPKIEGVFETDNYNYRVINENEVSIVKYTGNEKNVKIPRVIDNKKVTMIDNSSFTNADINSVEIPFTVTTIEYMAFLNDKNLTNVYIENGSVLNSIKASAFGKTGITSFEIPETVTEIGDYAFAESNLSDITVPDSVIELGAGAFCGTQNLQNASIGVGVKELKGWTFARSGLNQINFSNTLKKIGSGAFFDSGLISVDIPDSVEKMDPEVFSYCKKLKEAKIGKNLREITTNTFNDSSLEFIIIPDNIVSIGKSAFSGCNLQKIVIPDSVTDIEAYAFSDCNKLSYVEIGNNLTYIGSCVFANTAVKDVILGGNVKELGPHAFRGSSELCAINIPDNVTRIEYSCFENSPKLKDIKFPKNLQMIERNALKGTAWLEEKPDNSDVYAGQIYYQYKGNINKNQVINIKDGTVGIAGGAFEKQNNLSGFDIPSSVKEIGAYTTFNCKNLKRMYIPATVKYVGDRAFGFKGSNYHNCYKDEDFVVVGEKGSAAEMYANKYGFAFDEVEWLPTEYNWTKENNIWRCIATSVSKDNKVPLRKEIVDATEIKTEPTCTEDGKLEFVATFKNSWAEKQIKSEMIPKLNHDWDYTVNWSDKFDACTVTRICKIDSKHKEVANGKITHEIITPATCELKGKIKHTADFEEQWAEEAIQTQKDQIEIVNAFDHKWLEPVVEWSEDGKTCSVYRLCEHDSKHNEHVKAIVVPTVVKEPTCSKKGVTSYTVTYTFDGKEYTNSTTREDININSNKHENVVKVEKVNPTCTEKGHEEYFHCNACNKNYKDEACTKEIKNLADLSIKELGHSWDKEIVEWSKDALNCKISRTCKNDRTHVEIFDAMITSEITTSSTNVTKGITTYTAEYEIDGHKFKTQTKRQNVPLNSKVEEKLEIEELNEVPKELKNTVYNTVKKINKALIEKADKILDSVKIKGEKKIEIFDAVLNIVENGVERPATKEEIEERGGITIVIPYPEGTNKKDYVFTVSHMLTISMSGMQAGDIETPEVILTDEGLKVTLKGLSPVIVGYAEKATATDKDKDKTPVKPNEHKKPIQPSKSNNNASPKTGDTTNFALYVGLISAAIICVWFIIYKKKKYN